MQREIEHLNKCPGSGQFKHKQEASNGWKRSLSNLSSYTHEQKTQTRVHSNPKAYTRNGADLENYIS